MLQNSFIKVDDYVVEYQGNHGNHCFSCPEVMHMKYLKDVALFEIFVYILIIGARSLVSSDFLW